LRLSSRVCNSNESMKFKTNSEKHRFFYKAKLKEEIVCLSVPMSKPEFFKCIFRAGVGLPQRHPIAPVKREAEYCIENSTGPLPVTQHPPQTYADPKALSPQK